MSRETSQRYVDGAADALRDNDLVAQHNGCAIGPEVGPGYPNNMYTYGYRENFAPVPHTCIDKCRKDDTQ